jgi:hypothetical protein
MFVLTRGKKQKLIVVAPKLESGPMPAKTLKVDSLELDLENPRITLARDQRDAMQKIILEQKARVVNLA